MTPNYIAVCTPARDMVHANYTFCMVNMVAYHTINTMDAVSLKIMQGTLIQNQRADLCLDAMREGCTHVLFVDSDMTFPQDMIERVLVWQVRYGLIRRGSVRFGAVRFWQAR